MIALLARVVCAVVGHKPVRYERRSLMHGLLRRYWKCERCEKEVGP